MTLSIQTDLSYNLNLLSEEASEVIQAVSKIQRFGEMSISPYNNTANIFLLIKEINDFMAVVELLQDYYGIPFIDNQRVEEKKQKIAQYKIYSLEEGLLQENNKC